MRRKTQDMEKRKLKDYTHEKLNKKKTLIRGRIVLIVIFLIISIFVFCANKPILEVIGIKGKQAEETNAEPRAGSYNIYKEQPFTEEYSVGAFVPREDIEDWNFGSGFAHVGVDTDNKNGGAGGNIYIGTNTSKESNVYRDIKDGFKMGSKSYDVRTYFWLVEGDDFMVMEKNAFGGYQPNQQEGDTFSDGYETLRENTVMAMEFHFYESGTLGTSNPKEVSVKGIGALTDIDHIEGYKFISGVNNSTGIYLTRDTTIINAENLDSAGLTNPYKTSISGAWFGTVDANLLLSQELFYQFDSSPSNPLQMYYYAWEGWHSSIISELKTVTYHLSGDEPDTGLGKGDKDTGTGTSDSVLDNIDYPKDPIYVATYGTYTIIDSLSVDGYTFTGWKLGSANGENVSGKTISPITGNIDLYGSFSKDLVQDAPFSYEPQLTKGQDGININYTDLVEYNDGANGGKGTPKPYNCIERNVKAQCSYGSHYYRVESYSVVGDPVLVSGGEPTLTSATKTVSWSKYDDNTYKVGPYRINFTGTLESITIITDKGSSTLNNNSSSSDGNYRVGNIVSGQDFYIYLKKSLGAKKVTNVKVKVKDTSVYKEFRRYILTCYKVEGSHYNEETGTQYDCTTPQKTQQLEHYQYDNTSKTVSKEVTLPGALGIVQLKIIKKDMYDTNILVEGAKYELWSNGKKEYSGTTNANGTAIIEEVLIGDYTIKEVEVPEGYEIAGYATLNGKTYTDLTNITATLDEDATIYVYNESYMDLGGKVFWDKTGGKGTRENGYYNSSGNPGDEPIPGISVTLYSTEPNSKPETVFTDSEGNYQFEHKSKEYQYYIKFTYNGQIYEPTTYNVGQNSNTPDRKLRSYATETPSERKTFNEKFSPVDRNNTVPLWTDKTNNEFLIDAYTGANGSDDILYYDKDNTEDELLNINLGLLEREQFDLNIRKDLVDVQLRINGKEHTYNYPGGKLSLDVDMRGTDVAPYEREIPISDLGYEGQNKLEVYITYVIQIQNQSVGQITGYVTDLNDYYDTSYILMESWDENNERINWTTIGTVSENGKTYSKMHTTDLADVGITDKKYIYIKYQLKDETIRQLFETNEETTEENLVEIAGYRNAYTEAKQDLNGKTIANAGETAGLIDIDSTPDNMNPVSSKVQNFIEKSKTNEYQNLGGEEKTTQSREVFEDDADYAPGLRIIPSDVRTISGTVFEDTPIAEKLKDENERIGDGELTADDTRRINQVQVELICVQENSDGEWQENTDVMDYYESTDGQSVSEVNVRTNANGEYTISGYIPGDYILRFTYGDEECLKAVQNDDEMYTGQDYKSTLWDSANYGNDNNDWYKDETPRINDATDNQTRREEVNSYSRTLQYSNVTILDSDKDSSNVNTLAEKTYMYADTALMSMQIEYLGNEEEEYDIKNVDFGIIERPRTKVALQKNVESVKLIAVDGTTIFDSTGPTTGLTWVTNKYDDMSRELKRQGFMQGAVDSNILYGSTVQVSYSFKIINDSEVDYNDIDYYEKGIKPDNSKLNKINVNKIIDYIPNVFSYNEGLTNSNGEIIISENSEIPDDAVGITKPIDESLWQIKKDSIAGIEFDENEYRSSGNELLAEDVFNAINDKIDTIVQFPGTSNYPSQITGLIDSDPTKSKGLLGPDGEIKLKNALTISRVISSEDDLKTADGTPEKNVAEILQLTIDNGRRPYYEETRDNAGGGSSKVSVTLTPGNANPLDSTTWYEVDTAISEEVQFAPPFGKDKSVQLIIVIVVALGILLIGIYLIKKKVLSKP